MVKKRAPGSNEVDWIAIGVIEDDGDLFGAGGGEWCVILKRVGVIKVEDGDVFNAVFAGLLEIVEEATTDNFAHKTIDTRELLAIVREIDSLFETREDLEFDGTELLEEFSFHDEAVEAEEVLGGEILAGGLANFGRDLREDLEHLVEIGLHNQGAVMGGPVGVGGVFAAARGIETTDGLFFANHEVVLLNSAAHQVSVVKAKTLNIELVEDAGLDLVAAVALGGSGLKTEEAAIVTEPIVVGLEIFPSPVLCGEFAIGRILVGDVVAGVVLGNW